jgi:hypothetical protein|nr:MAG TPA: hypothetical protein [Caudoviricetes sp.]
MILKENECKQLFQRGVYVIKRNARDKDTWNKILLLSQSLDVFCDLDYEKDNIMNYMFDILHAFLKHYKKRLTQTQGNAFKTAVLCQVQAVIVAR